MNKALPWNINGVGFDARDAARQAARRQGKSLGEWLHGVIADHAAELGVEEHEIAGQDRIDAVTSRLERLGARGAGFDRKAAPRAERSEPPRRRVGASDRDDDDHVPSRRPIRQDSDDEFEERRPRRAAPVIQETELLLEDAIESMERRAQRSERRTDTALASFAKLLESNEAKRERERDAVLSMAQKLTDIETRLNHGPADETPIKGALARLEARLDVIGRRSAAETSARVDGTGLDKRPDGAEPMRRLEDKLNFILEAINDRPASQMSASGQVSSAAIIASQGRGPVEPRNAAPVPQRRLGDAIAEISRRQRSLESGDATAASVRPMRRVPEPIVDRDPNPKGASIGAIQGEISTLGGKIEEMRRDFMRRVDRRPEPPVDIDGLRAEIATMSQTLRALAPHDATPRPTADVVVDDLRRALAEIDPRKTIGALHTDIRSIGNRIEDLSAAGIDKGALDRIHDQMAEIRDLVSVASRPSGIDQVERVLETLSTRFDDRTTGVDGAQDIQAAANEIRRMIAISPGPAAFEKIEQRLEALSGKVDQAIETATRGNDLASHRFDPIADQRPSTADVPDMSGLERLVRDLGTKIEAAQAPGAGANAIEALERQIGMLSTRFDAAEGGLASLSTLERSMHELFAHLEETRSNVETAAARAAREVLRVAADESRGYHDARSGHDIAALRSLHDEADQRTHSTLNVVHKTLEQVVGRLSSMEGDIAEVRTRAVAPTAPSFIDAPPMAAKPAIPSPVAERSDAPTPARPVARSAPAQRGFQDLEMMLGAADPLVPALQKPASRAQPGTRGKPIDLDDEAGRADFIAAARRAAHAAQSDPSVMAMKRPAVGTPNSDARAGLIARSRDYVANHKKPVLLSIAAILVIIGTMAVMQRLGLEETQVADVAPAKIQRMADATPRKPIDASPSGNPVTGDLSPSALPTTKGPVMGSAIPGSDPIQTGSIPSLPAFAAQGATTRSVTATLSPGLKTMAESGDGAAEFELGSRYAEGKLVPRDFVAAAKWYAKAADQGLAPAQYRLASLYEKGLGVTQDKTKAKALYLKAADAGNPRAMHNLAVLLADGDGKPDYDGAATWFRKAAQYGVHDSQFNLAILLARGLGVPQSLVQSYQWFAVAADQNDSDAAHKRDEVGSKLNANDLAVAKALASAFHPRSPNVAATEVSPPPGGWDGASGNFHINSARPKISSL
jgi:localization factor PodJL